MKTCKEYRIEGRGALSGNTGTAIGMLIVFGIINSLVTFTLIGTIVLSGAMTVGYSMAYINLHRCKTLNFRDLFGGFSNGINFGSTIGLWFKTFIFTFLWGLLFVIPGIIAAYRYAMAPYILADNPGITAGQAINASKKVMVGKKGKLFLLGLSYIGWILLSVLTFGILLLWVLPWMSSATASFYESIKDEIVIE